MFAAIDARDAAAFAGFLTPDARFRYANQPAVSGSAAIEAAVDAFFASVQGCRHTVNRVWDTPGTLIVEGEVEYLRLDGGAVNVPFVDVLALAGERVTDYRIYLDPAPLFAG